MVEDMVDIIKTPGSQVDQAAVEEQDTAEMELEPRLLADREMPEDTDLHVRAREVVVEVVQDLVEVVPMFVMLEVVEEAG
jgi:hypothetical protein